VTVRPDPVVLLERADAFLTRTDLTELGLPRQAVDAVFRACPTVHIPGYRRPLLLVRDFLAWRESVTYHGDRVRA
jgi:hypothetical protein